MLGEVDVSLFADFDNDVFGLDCGDDVEITSQKGVHLFVDVSPLFEGDAKFSDDVIFLEVVFLQKTDRLQTISS